VAQQVLGRSARRPRPDPSQHVLHHVSPRGRKAAKRSPCPGTHAMHTCLGALLGETRERVPGEGFRRVLHHVSGT
jgi:hypothetical protein